MDLKRLSYKHKNNKIVYYLRNYLRQIIPINYYQKKLTSALSQFDALNSKDQEVVIDRLNYYNKLDAAFALSDDARALSDFNLKQDPKIYFFDLFEFSRYFSQALRVHCKFGDVTTVHNEPALVKSRPIHGGHTFSILLKWNKIRHFLFIKNDAIPFTQKKNILVSRGVVKPRHRHRISFLEKYFDHPICDIGLVNKKDPANLDWLVPRMTIGEHLQYKFILCLEGNDVASNLKWVMSSSSAAVMPKPKYETWFMEGRLIPDYHYIQIKDDYSDLEERLNYFIDNPDKTKAIIKNANAYVKQFKNQKLEDLISLMVLDKYFQKTNQTT